MSGVVFISHANPEDNDFTLWLGTQLATAGYEVWSDLTRLIGGEETWQYIDKAIRNDAAVVVLVLSRLSVTKQGLRNELAVADAVARRKAKTEFVLPVRVDDLPFDEVPPQVIAKNIIDFSHGWADGLDRVLKVFERDKIPRSPSSADDTLQRWVKLRAGQGNVLVDIPERLESNWFSILCLPKRLNFFEIGRPLKVGEIQALADLVSWPACAHLRFLLGFADLADFRKDLEDRAPLRNAFSVDLSDFLAGTCKEGPYIRQREARNLVTNLVRQAWERAAKSKGLEEYADAQGRKVHWVRAGLLNDDISRFRRGNGKRGWRKLVGRDNTRDLYWHFGVTAVPNILAPARFVFRQRVIFSKDGRTALGMRQRRTVCKSWFNARWRDLILAFGAFLAGGTDEIILPVSSTEGIRVSASPMPFEAPVSIALPQEQGRCESEEGDEDDFDGIERESDPAFAASDELEVDTEDDDTDEPS